MTNNSAKILAVFFTSLTLSITVSCGDSNNNKTSRTSTGSNSESLHVQGFIQDLGSGNFLSAYQRTQIPNWKGYDWFKSTDAYGGIVKTEIINVYTLSNSGGRAVVYAEYKSYDLSNRNGIFVEHFHCQNFNGQWKIVRIKRQKADYYN